MTAKLAVLIGFLLFIALMIWFRVPQMIAGLLDKRAERIKAQLDEAREAREEAQKLLASFERKHAETQREADAIVERARTDAERASMQAQVDLQESITRKLRSAEDRIGQAETAAIREVRNAAAAAAVAAASEVLGQKVSGSQADALIDEGIETVGSRLN